MLYAKAIETPTLDLIKKLQSKTYLQGFYLAGDMALALHFGHRKSIDNDIMAKGDRFLTVLRK
jgi:hypothetical protein